jgi:hypothetical protein
MFAPPIKKRLVYWGPKRETFGFVHADLVLVGGISLLFGILQETKLCNVVIVNLTRLPSLRGLE